MARSHSGGLDCGSVASAKDDVSGPDSEHRPTDEQEREGELSVFYGRGSRVEEEAGVSGRWADLDIVNLVLAKAEEQFTRQCSLRRRGYDLEKIAERIAEMYGINGGGGFRERSPAAAGGCTESILFVGGAGIGKFPFFLGHTLRDEPGGGWLCRTKGRGHYS